MFVQVIGNTRIHHFLKIGEFAEVLSESDKSLKLKGVDKDGRARTQHVSRVDVRYNLSHNNDQMAFLLKREGDL